MTGFKYNGAEEQRGLIEGTFPVFDAGPVDHKCPVRSSFIYACQSRVCKCGNKGKSHLEVQFRQLKLINHKWNKNEMYSNVWDSVGSLRASVEVY